MIPGYLAGALRDRPMPGGYQWRARTHRHAVEAIARAEAVHGPPVPTCLHCGGTVTYNSRKVNGYCTTCGRSPMETVQHYGKRAVLAGLADGAR